jgi:RNA-directed DNA polymerase
MDKTKPYEISKNIVLEAFKRVKENRGAAGIDDESIEAFESDLNNNLYKIWNRMTSGSYFPPPVKAI